MKRRAIVLLLLLPALAACTLQRGEDRVWRPGDPDPGHETFYGPWSGGKGTEPYPASGGRRIR